MASAPRPIAKHMPQVDLIEDLERLNGLRAAWQRLAEIDPTSGVFLSFEWMQMLFADNPGTWQVLVLRNGPEAQDISAILPLRHKFHWSESQGSCETRYDAAGRLGLSDVTGFLCAPDQEDDAIRALGRYMADQKWKRLSLRYVRPASRARIFASAFDPERFSIKWPPYTGNTKSSNQLCVPTVPLPDSFERYLQESVSKSIRGKIRRFRRKHLDNGPYHITLTTQETFAQNADALIRIWQTRWRGELSESAMRSFQKKQRLLLERCQKLNALFMPVLWHETRPVGVLARLIDAPNLTMMGLIAARDTHEALPCIGLLLNAFCIENAINMGLRTYALGHGTDPYKYQYGAIDRHLAYLTIRRRGRNPDEIFGDVSVPQAAKLASRELRNGNERRANKILRQVEATRRKIDD